jgi:hypothetical protein
MAEQVVQVQPDRLQVVPERRATTMPEELEVEPFWAVVE